MISAELWSGRNEGGSRKLEVAEGGSSNEWIQDICCCVAVTSAMSAGKCRRYTISGPFPGDFWKHFRFFGATSVSDVYQVEIHQTLGGSGNFEYPVGEVIT